MKYTDKNKIRESINSAAASGTQFFFAVNYDVSEGVFIENPLSQNKVLFQFNGIGNKPTDIVVKEQPSLTVMPIGIESYKVKFDTAYEGLKQGVAQVINLTVSTPIETNISPKEIFSLSQSPYQVYVPEEFVCFSPERFVKISDGIISSNPMKGTIDASLIDAEQEILNDPKEIAEHTATTQLIVDELALVATDVKVNRFRYIDRIESRNRTLLQVSSEVVGTLDDDYMTHLGDIVFKLLPAGSIAGSPKKAALELINRAENDNRGYYCGIAGYFDGSSLDTAVLIRFIESDGEKQSFRSGGGITVDSICEKEYQEVLNKIYLPFV